MTFDLSHVKWTCLKPCMGQQFSKEEKRRLAGSSMRGGGEGEVKRNWMVRRHGRGGRERVNRGQKRVGGMEGKIKRWGRGGMNEHSNFTDRVLLLDSKAHIH